MKHILTVLFLAFASIALAVPPLPIISRTGKISLQWTASVTPSVTYKLYHSTNNLTWDKTYPGITGTSYTVTNIPSGSLNWFLVTAVNMDGIESDPSNVLEKPIESKPAAPTGLLSVPVVVSVESRLNNEPWLTFRKYTNHVIGDTDELSRQFRSFVSVGAPIELVEPR